MTGKAEPGPEDQRAAALLRRMASGEVAALDSLYRLYHRSLLGLFTMILRDPFEAEEVLQDTFVRAFREAGRFDEQLGTAYAWLATIGRRMCIDRIRKRQRRPELPVDSMEQPGVFGDNYPGNDPERVRRQLEANLLQNCLGGLAEAQREAIELAFFRGFTHQEIAEKLDKPLGTVKSDLHRGLMQLRKEYLESHDR